MNFKMIRGMSFLFLSRPLNSVAFLLGFQTGQVVPFVQLDHGEHELLVAFFLFARDELAFGRTRQFYTQ